jgi:transcriptional regulator with XRE-family HTH domain
MLFTYHLTVARMPSELGQLIRTARQQKDIGLRAFAKLIGKSPGFVTQLECEDEVPSVAEDTLRSVADHLGLAADRLLVLAQRTPSDVVPGSQLEVALYRKVKGLSLQEQERVQKYLEQMTRKREEG